MNELWIPITIAATVFQNVRSSLQKHLKDTLSTAGATYVRFLFAVPFALVYLLVVMRMTDVDFPPLNSRFALFVLIGGGTQILGTTLLIHMFSFRNFVVGTAYSKTETVQAAALGILILSDPITGWALTAIVISLVGVMLLAIAHQEFGFKTLLTSLFQKTAGIGLASGAFFGVAAVSYRAASLSLGVGFVVSAACTLATVLILQTVTMTAYLYFREPGQLSVVAGAWKTSSLVGLAGMLASACWFTAMTIQNAAHVRALGQIELFLAFLSSLIFFREKVKATEVVGVALVVAGILVLLLLG